MADGLAAAKGFICGSRVWWLMGWRQLRGSFVGLDWWLMACVGSFFLFFFFFYFFIFFYDLWVVVAGFSSSWCGASTVAKIDRWGLLVVGSKGFG